MQMIKVILLRLDLKIWRCSMNGWKNKPVDYFCRDSEDMETLTMYEA